MRVSDQDLDMGDTLDVGSRLRSCRGESIFGRRSTVSRWGMATVSLPGSVSSGVDMDSWTPDMS